MPTLTSSLAMAPAALLTLLVLGAAPARAADPLPVRLDGDARLGLQLRIGFPQSDADVDVITPRLDALIPVGEDGAIALQWAMGYAGAEDESRFVIGNLFAGYAFNPRPTLRFTPGLVLPLAQISDDLGDALEQVVTYALSAAANGGRDIWLYMPETFGVVAPLHSVIRVSADVFLEADAALAILFPDSGDNDVELMLDTDIAVAFSVVRLGIGAWVRLTGDDDDDRAVITATAGVRVPIGHHLAWADFMVTLDDPALFDDGAIPSLVLGFVAHL